MLSDSDIVSYRIAALNEVDFEGLWKLWAAGTQADWDSLASVDGQEGTARKGIIIEPFQEESLCPGGYDLTLGNEYRNLCDLTVRHDVDDGEFLRLRPGETVLAIPKEIIAVSPEFSAMIVPRALLDAQGCQVSTQIIPPTWYGRPVLTVSNTSTGDLLLKPGETQIATCVFFRLTSPSGKVLRRGPGYSPGRLHLEVPIPREVLIERTRMPEEDLPDDKIRVKPLYLVARSRGYPWTLLYGLWKSRDQEWAEELGGEALRVARNLLRAEWRAKVKVLGSIAAVLGALVAILAYLAGARAVYFWPR